MHRFAENNNPPAVGNGAIKKAEMTFYAMGTVMSFVAYGKHAQRMLEAVKAIIVELDGLLSRMRPDSEISQLNLSPGRWLRVREETDGALREALRCARITNGAYEPAIGSLVNLWDMQNNHEGRAPDADAIKRVLASCDYHNIETDHAGRYRISNGASIDLGGIGKGYAADLIYSVCKGEGIASALFSLGTSSIAVWGARPDDTPWRIGLKTADTEKIECFGVAYLKDEFLSTSGDCQQYVVRGGRRYHHIFDKATGYPPNNGLRSVTVIADSGAMSEAYSTALLVMGLRKGLAFQEAEGDFEALWVTSDEQIICTSGVKERFEFRGRALGYSFS